MRRLLLGPLIILALAPAPPLAAQRELGRLPLDRSKPVPPKSDILAAWQARQQSIPRFRFTWTEEQTHPRRWVPNPRYPERERAATPALFRDRTYRVTKTLAVDGSRMRYSLELDRADDLDSAQGLGEGKRFLYMSVFDGQSGITRLTSLNDSLPPLVRQSAENVDAQNLDLRPIMITLRPLDPVLGFLLVGRAVTNQMRMFYQGRSTMLLEERRDPWGWKSLLWMEPERDFLVSRYIHSFEQRVMVVIDIDYTQDPRWGWIPSGWRVSQKLTDGTMRLVTRATVTSYSINEPISPSEFQ